MPTSRWGLNAWRGFYENATNAIADSNARMGVAAAGLIYSLDKRGDICIMLLVCRRHNTNDKLFMEEVGG